MRIQLRAFACALVPLVAMVVSPRACAEDWQPIVPEDLAMTSEPKAPGAAAIYLYREVDRDDTQPSETIYERIKILSEAGRKYADIEIPFRKGAESVYAIQARTIRPDGTIIKFDGTVFDKTIVKGHGVKYLAKTFALPDAQVGSIIEYRYRHALESGYVFDSHWILSQELYTRLAKFSLERYEQFTLTWSWPMGLPAGTEAPKEKSGKIRLEARDIAAFPIEDDMPPENELRMRVDFIYSDAEDSSKDADEYWKQFARRRFREVSFERDKTEQEAKRENLKTVHDAEDVWRRGYGNGEQVTWLFLALARAAGLQADAVLIPTRDKYFFSRRLMNQRQLNSNLVVVSLDGLHAGAGALSRRRRMGGHSSHSTHRLACRTACRPQAHRVRRARRQAHHNLHRP